MYRYADLFCGIGGFRLGFENKSFTCQFSSEIDTHAKNMYELNFNELPIGDVAEINHRTVEDIEEVDMITGGFPCQPFSISGKQEGFEDKSRGTLFFEIIRLMRLAKPKVVFLENVAHLVNHNNGDTFSTILEALREEGYTVHYRVLDASKFGLPQHRKRIYFVAFRQDVPFSFPEGTSDYTPLNTILLKDHGQPYLSPEEYTLIDHPKVSPNNMCFVGYLNKNIRKKGVKEDSLHLSRVHKQINRIYSSDYVHPTLTSSETSGRYYIHDGIGVRKLAIEEVFRLQGFPDDFIKNMSRSQLYRQIGNSVPIPVIRAIGKEIEKSLSFFD